MDATTRFNPRNAVKVTSAIILVATEVLAAALAGGWALAGLMGLGGIFFWVTEAVFLAIGLMAVWAFTRRALAAEPIRTAARP